MEKIEPPDTMKVAETTSSRRKRPPADENVLQPTKTPTPQPEMVNTDHVLLLDTGAPLLTKRGSAGGGNDGLKVSPPIAKKNKGRILKKLNQMKQKNKKQPV